MNGKEAAANVPLQLFMRNALDDLTRPATPLLVRVARLRGGVRISVRRFPDARPRRLLVYAGKRLVCNTAKTSCVDKRAGVRRLTYTVVLRDRWRTSFAVKAR